jgi:hypothetical protein
MRVKGRPNLIGKNRLVKFLTPNKIMCWDSEETAMLSIDFGIFSKSSGKYWELRFCATFREVTDFDIQWVNFFT